MTVKVTTPMPNTDHKLAGVHEFTCSAPMSISISWAWDAKLNKKIALAQADATELVLKQKGFLA